jgi:phosphomannomutase/phosphomannomutase/phosphoglucomutase
MTIKIDCFKAYDIRGRIPDQLNEDIAYRIGNATAEFLSASTIVLGRDIRLSSGELADAISRGINDAGADVIDIGLCGTEVVYFATGDLGVDGGIMVTASHNPADYNGLKLVREQSKPISADTGLMDIKAIAERDERKESTTQGARFEKDVSNRYVDRLMSFIDPDKLKPLKIVSNPGNGGAGIALDLIEPRLPFEFVKLHHEPDGTFPNGVPNPMLEENRGPTVDAIRESGADFGIAWDGDFDRCFFFDETGRFIEGYYIVGLLAQALLAENPGSSIIYDPRLTWNTIEIVTAAGGRAIQSKSGHSFIKQVMREEDALYGGEMSAHHYFRNFFYCDSGIIPWLLVAQLVSTSGKKLSELVDDRMSRFPTSGEINRQVADAPRAIEELTNLYAKDAKSVDKTDGVSIEFEDWRFNLRASNTEPVIRLNVESRANEALMQEKVSDILDVLERMA